MPDKDRGWDEYLFKGAAPYYQSGRMPYAPRLAEALRDVLDLDGSGTLVDFGSGPGVLALLLAAEFETVLAVEPDPEMAALGQRNTAAAGLTNVQWLVTTAEDLALEPNTIDVAAFGQSFHWMDRPAVASSLRTALRPAGHVILISDVKTFDPAADPNSGPPTAAVNRLIAEYLGDVRRAGQRLLPNGTPGDEEEILLAAGYLGPQRLSVDNPGMAFRSVDTLMAEVYSKSSSAPHLFGDRLDEFDARLRGLLSAEGGYWMVKPSTEARIWTNP
jgi:SAM-dependent methyltransferase